MTVYKPISTLTKEAAELAVRMAKGEFVNANQKINNGKIVVPAVLLPPIAVDKDNMNRDLLTAGYNHNLLLIVTFPAPLISL